MSGGMLNTQLIDERRTQLNMSAHALNKAAALMHRVNHNGQPGPNAHVQMTLADLSRLAAVLGVTPAALLTPPDEPPTVGPADDAAILVAALMDESRVTLAHKDDVARALGWPLHRVDEAARQATDHLPALGLHLHHNPHGGLAVRALHGVVGSEEQQRLARAKTQRTNLRADQARMLRDIAHGKVNDPEWQRSLGQRRRVTFWALRKRGLIEEAPSGLELSPTVAYSLMLTDEPPPDDLDVSSTQPDPNHGSGSGSNVTRSALRARRLLVEVAPHAVLSLRRPSLRSPCATRRCPSAVPRVRDEADDPPATLAQRADPDVPHAGSIVGSTEAPVLPNARGRQAMAAGVPPPGGGWLFAGRESFDPVRPAATALC